MKQIIAICGTILIMFFLISSITGCSDDPYVDNSQATIHRVLVLENRAVDYVWIPKTVSTVIGEGDTVWVNLGAHRLGNDDIDRYTMKCVILGPRMIE